MESSWVHSSSILNDLDAERTNNNHNSPDVVSGLTVVTMMDVHVRVVGRCHTVIESIRSCQYMACKHVQLSRVVVATRGTVAVNAWKHPLISQWTRNTTKKHRKVVHDLNFISSQVVHYEYVMSISCLDFEVRARSATSNRFMAIYLVTGTRKKSF